MITMEIAGSPGGIATVGSATELCQANGGRWGFSREHQVDFIYL